MILTMIILCRQLLNNDIEIIRSQLYYKDDMFRLIIETSLNLKKIYNFLLEYGKIIGKVIFHIQLQKYYQCVENDKQLKSLLFCKLSDVFKNHYCLFHIIAFK